MVIRIADKENLKMFRELSVKSKPRGGCTPGCRSGFACSSLPLTPIVPAGFKAKVDEDDHAVKCSGFGI